MAGPERDAKIWALKRQLGEHLVILGHHYQRDEVIQFADFRGDSFKLSQQAAGRGDAEYILFCGVHFMAESADILSQPHQQVILPNLEAGCSMADMAKSDDVQAAWDALAGLGISDVVPITYMNSAAALKAFCGRNGGIVCTSSNAGRVFDWAFERGEKLLFFPDEHLGRNTGVKKGIPTDEMVVWDPFLPLGGNTPEALQAAKLILWKGYCSVHARFSVEQIAAARAEHPGVNVIVHPECRLEVVQAADCDGSTEFIIDTITRRARRHDLGSRDRDQPRQPPQRGASRQARLLPRSGHLPLLDDVPRPSRLRALVAGASGARRGRQPDHRRPRHRPRRAGRAGPHARRAIETLPQPGKTSEEQGANAPCSCFATNLCHALRVMIAPGAPAATGAPPHGRAIAPAPRASP